MVLLWNKWNWLKLHISLVFVLLQVNSQLVRTEKNNLSWQESVLRGTRLAFNEVFSFERRSESLIWPRERGVVLSFGTSEVTSLDQTNWRAPPEA